MTESAKNSLSVLPEPLSEREQEIVACLAKGLSNQEIARQLHLSEKTVRWYNTQIYRKLDVGGRKEAVAQAGRFGLLACPSPPSVSHNIPVQATAFIGRQRELAKIIGLLAEGDVRLLTILAPGGMGKTRLSLEVAKALLGRNPDGVFFVSLAPLTHPDDVVLAIAEQIGFTFYGGGPPSQQLLSFLQNRSMLLVLDNFEHLLDASRYVDDIIRTAPHVRVLTTSRERLSLQRETVYILRGLDFPLGESLKDLVGHDAVKLFMQQAHRVRPDFELQMSDLQNLSQICRLTAGMPLAIELAAGWLDSLSLDHIAAEIQQGIDIFETELRDVPERHRSIRATFDLTWQRLAEANQQVFMRLSVFRGGFTAEAATAIAGANRHSLRKLHSHALVEVLDGGRYNLHELLRQFGAEKLDQAMERSNIQSKHTAYFANFMVERRQEIRTNQQLVAVERIDPDFENVRLAWLNALKEPTCDTLLKFMDSLWFYCEVRTRSQDGIELLQQAVQIVRAAPPTAENERMLGSSSARLAWFYYDVGLAAKSVAAGDEAIRILRQFHNHPELLAALYSRQAVAISHQQAAIGDHALQEGLRLARLMHDKNWEGHFLVWSAISYIVRNDTATARGLVEEGLAIFECLGDQWGLMRAYTVLGDIEETQKKYERARFCFQQSLMVSESFGHNFTMGANHTHLASVASREGNDRLARRHFRAALTALWGAGYLWAAAFPLACIARMSADQNDPIKAIEILGTIDNYLTAFRRNDQIARTLANELTAVIEPDRFAAAWEQGQQQDIGALIVNLLAELS